MSVQTPAAERPLLRGYLHLAGALASPFALALLMVIADSPRGYVGGAIFGVSLILLYSTSAMHHLMPMGRRLRAVIRRLDRSIIFIFIAGSYAPFAIKLMSNAWGIPVMSVVGALALGGFITTLAAPQAPRWLRVGLYVGLGWIGLVAISELVTSLPGRAFAMLVLSGLLYSAGGLTYAIQRPNPFPRVFGYHELFHALQMAATALIYSIVVLHVLGS